MVRKLGRKRNVSHVADTYRVSLREISLCSCVTATRLYDPEVMAMIKQQEYVYVW